ncbi:MAG: hypothetical protein AB7G80_09310 [Dongiaceae bacterium]
MSSPSASASKTVFIPTEHDKFLYAAIAGQVGEVRRILAAAKDPSTFVNYRPGNEGGNGERTVLMHLCHCGLIPSDGLNPGFASWANQFAVVEAMLEKITPAALNYEYPLGLTALDFLDIAAKLASSVETEKDGTVKWRYQGPQTAAQAVGHIDKLRMLLMSKGAVKGSGISEQKRQADRDAEKRRAELAAAELATRQRQQRLGRAAA